MSQYRVNSRPCRGRHFIQCLCRLSTAPLPTLTLPWWPQERVRPPLAPSEVFRLPPGVCLCVWWSKIQIQIQIQIHRQVRGAGGSNKQCRASFSGEGSLHSDSRHIFYHFDLFLFSSFLQFLSPRLFSSLVTVPTGGDAVSLRSPSPPLPTASQGKRHQTPHPSSCLL